MFFLEMQGTVKGGCNMDLVLFFEQAMMDGVVVQVALKNGQSFSGIPDGLEEDDDLGYLFRLQNGELYCISLSDVKTAEKIPALRTGLA
jgi:hypothetical protein